MCSSTLEWECKYVIHGWFRAMIRTYIKVIHNIFFVTPKEDIIERKKKKKRNNEPMGHKLVFNSWMEDMNLIQNI